MGLHRCAFLAHKVFMATTPRFFLHFVSVPDKGQESKQLRVIDITSGALLSKPNKKIKKTLPSTFPIISNNG